MAQVSLRLGFCTLQNSNHATILGSEFADMNQGEAPKRMHDPKSYLASNFVQEHARIQYAHQDELDDSIYRAAIDFQEVLSRIADPNSKAHIFQNQKDLKISMLDFGQVKMTVEKNIQRKNLEKEAKEKGDSSSSALASKSKYKGKVFLESPART